jgi:hypothetical protein
LLEARAPTSSSQSCHVLANGFFRWCSICIPTGNFEHAPISVVVFVWNVRMRILRSIVFVSKFSKWYAANFSLSLVLQSQTRTDFSHVHRTNRRQMHSTTRVLGNCRDIHILNILHLYTSAANTK